MVAGKESHGHRKVAGSGEMAAQGPAFRNAQPFQRAALQQATGTIPIWLAALIASRCQSTRSGADSAIRWNCVSGKAFYTNRGPDTETIQPLGVQLKSGQTLAVDWAPGDSGYTLEVYYRQ